MAARMAMTTMTTRSSTIVNPVRLRSRLQPPKFFGVKFRRVKPLVVCKLGLLLELELFFTLLERERERESCFFHNLLSYYS